MLSVCEQCANEFTGTPVKCMGFCSSLFCKKCSGMTDETQRLIDTNNHLVWMCFACCNILSKSRFHKSVASVNAANEKIIDALKTEIKDSILQDIRTEIRDNFKTLVEAVPSTPLAIQPPPFRPSSRSKRQRDTDVDDDSTNGRPSKQPCATGTRYSEVGSLAINSTSAAPEFWLYLSGIQPDVEEDQVRHMVQESLATNDLKVVKLIPKNRDLRTLSFVSFKVGVSADLREKAMSADTWPRGIRFREFEDHSLTRQGFWRPTAVPVITVPQTIIIPDPQQPSMG